MVVIVGVLMVECLCQWLFFREHHHSLSSSKWWGWWYSFGYFVAATVFIHFNELRVDRSRSDGMHVHMHAMRWRLLLQCWVAPKVCCLLLMVMVCRRELHGRLCIV